YQKHGALTNAWRGGPACRRQKKVASPKNGVNLADAFRQYLARRLSLKSSKQTLPGGTRRPLRAPAKGERSNGVRLDRARNRHRGNLRLPFDEPPLLRARGVHRVALQVPRARPGEGYLEAAQQPRTDRVFLQPADGQDDVPGSQALLHPRAHLQPRALEHGHGGG